MQLDIYIDKYDVNVGKIQVLFLGLHIELIPSINTNVIKEIRWFMIDCF